MKKITVLASVTLIVVLSTTAYAHPGRLDANGGHNKKADGTYHYHRSTDRSIEYNTYAEAYPSESQPPSEQNTLSAAQLPSEQKNSSAAQLPSEQKNSSATQLPSEQNNLPPAQLPSEQNALSAVQLPSAQRSVEKRSEIIAETVIDNIRVEAFSSVIMVSVGTIYDFLVPLTTLKDYMKLDVAVSDSGFYSCSREDRYLIVFPNSSTIDMNGEESFLLFPAFLKKEELYVPLRLFVGYFGGDIAVKESEKESVIEIKTTKSVKETGSKLVNTTIKEGELVYWGTTGTKIHMDEACDSFVYEVFSGSLEEAMAVRKGGWCKRCSDSMPDLVY